MTEYDIHLLSMIIRRITVRDAHSAVIYGVSYQREYFPCMCDNVIEIDNVYVPQYCF